MQAYKYYQALGLSFYSKPLYRDVAQNWQGKGFLYVLFLVSLLTLATIFSAFHARNLFLVEMEPIFSQLPTITIQDGQASIDKSEPYFIKDKNGKDLMVIDTTGKINSFDKTSAEAILTKTQFLVKRNANSTQTFELSKIKNGVYDQAKIHQLVRYASVGFIIAVLLLFFLWRWIKGVLAVLLMAGIGRLTTHTTLDYSALCRIAAVALTPVIIIAMVLELLHITIPFITLLYVAVAIAYFFYGIEANKPVVTTPQQIQ